MFRRLSQSWVSWPAVLLALTVTMLSATAFLDKAHIALLFLLVVLGGSAAGGRTLGVFLALVSFFLFNFFFIPPYRTFVIANPLDWLVLLVFLATGIVAAQLLYRAQAEAESARLRAEEVDRLSAEAERAAALIEADKMKDALLASVSHDIRTPLTTIRALAHDIAAEGDHRALVIEEESMRLNRFVSDLLDLSRLSAGTIPLSLDINVAEDLIGAALQRMSGIPGSERIRPSIDPDQPLLAGRFDFTQSLRILVNLIENALKYSPADSKVEVSALREGNLIVFKVSDRGTGVPPDELSRIFTPFYRVASGRPDVGGTGLGLAIAHGLAVAQGGSLSYEPRSGGGSVFALRFRVADLENMEQSDSGQGHPGFVKS